MPYKSCEAMVENLDEAHNCGTIKDDEGKIIEQFEPSVLRNVALPLLRIKH